MFSCGPETSNKNMGGCFSGNHPARHPRQQTEGLGRSPVPAPPNSSIPPEQIQDFDLNIKISEILRDGSPAFFGPHLCYIVNLFAYMFA